MLIKKRMAKIFVLSIEGVYLCNVMTNYYPWGAMSLQNDNFAR